MKIKEIRELSAKEVRARIRELKEETFHMRLQQSSGQLEKPSQFRVLRREVARLQTILTEKTRAEAATVAVVAK